MKILLINILAVELSYGMGYGGNGGPANGVPLPPGSCIDSNPLCCFWASAGECGKNQYYMKPNCQQACGTCGCTVANAGNCPTDTSACGAGAPTQPPTPAVDPIPPQPPVIVEPPPPSVITPSPMAPEAPPTGCTDSDPNCGAWAGTGECNANPYWMKVNCGQACNSCGTSVNTVKAPPPVPGCADNDDLCSFWESIGECGKNPTYMSKSCALSCGACGGAPVPAPPVAPAGSDAMPKQGPKTAPGGGYWRWRRSR